MNKETELKIKNEELEQAHSTRQILGTDLVKKDEQIKSLEFTLSQQQETAKHFKNQATELKKKLKQKEAEPADEVSQMKIEMLQEQVK